MKKKTGFLICPFVAAVVLLMVVIGCKKEEPTPKINTIIIWENPADISFGTLLSVTQLNATAYVAGTFVYTPPIGTLLSLGENQDLNVDFTPTDLANYNVSSKTIKINVTQPTSVGGVSSVVFNTEKTYGTMTDQNGNTYKTIAIGSQTWMAENLRTTIYRDGDPMPNVTDSAAWYALTIGAYCSNANTSNKDEIATYGRLYNWYAISDSRNLAPTGWHVPTDAEWQMLIDYLGGDAVAGGKLKETGSTHWADPNGGATNSSGFSALPGGYRNYVGTFQTIGHWGYWWSSSSGGAYFAWVRLLNYGGSGVDRFTDGYRLGFSVRCIKD